MRVWLWSRLRRQLGILGLLTFSWVTMVACAPNRLFESFHPQYRAEEDCGFVQNVYGERISWKGKLPIKLKVHSAFPPEHLKALENAIQHWEESAGRRLFEITSYAAEGPIAPRQDGENIVYWMKTWEENKPQEQARTTVYWVGDQISEADIRLNNKNFNFYLEVTQNAGDVHLESLIIHELGHVLGLKHRDDTPSVMATYLASNTVRADNYVADTTDLRCEY